MAKKRASAQSMAQRRSNNGIWLDHATIVEEDFAWLESVERLILWNVHVPVGFLARLDKLWWLDIRGGSAPDLSVARGATKLRYLSVNQVRGMRDLSTVRDMLKLRYVAFYGLPQVRTFNATNFPLLPGDSTSTRPTGFASEVDREEAASLGYQLVPESPST
jgi:hypothetical protein